MRLKWLCGLLLFANLAAAWVWWLARPPKAPTLAPEIAAGALQVVSTTFPPVAPLIPPVAQPTEGTPETPSVAPAVPACFVWGNIPPAKLPDVRAAVTLLGIPFTEIREGTAPSRWWVYIPPLKTTEEAQATVKVLQTLGNAAFLVKTEKGFENAISLGLFSSKQAAERLVENLRQQGVNKPQILEKPQAAPSAPMALRFEAITPTQQAALQAQAKAKNTGSLSPCLQSDTAAIPEAPIL